VARGQGDGVTRGQGDRETGGRGDKEPSDDSRLPECAYRYFWDVDPVTLDVSKYPRYVIERLMEYGDLPSVCWMERRFQGAWVLFRQL
jgi:hypothetical protein